MCWNNGLYLSSVGLRMRGFSLIELMIVLALIATLSLVALPNYQDYVMKVRRLEASMILVQTSQALETYYAKHYAYEDFPASAIPSQSPINSNDKYYAITATLSPSSFLLQATPVGSQLSDGCAVLSLNQAGVKSASGDQNANCWR